MSFGTAFASARRATAASDLYRRLNGIVCVYKPAGYSVRRCMDIIRLKVVKDLNSIAVQEEASVRQGRGADLLQRLELYDGALKVAKRPAVASSRQTRNRQLLPRTAPAATVSSAADRKAALAVLSTPDVRLPAPASHLIYGDAFRPEDVRLWYVLPLGRRISGVLLLAVNGGIGLMRQQLAGGRRQLRCYQLTGRLGFSTDSLHADGRLTDRATYGHVTRARLEALLSGLQAAHQRLMYEHTGVPINSDAAYQLASRGLPRPAADTVTPPIIYSLRCVHYAPPFFTLEVHALSEHEDYLLTLVQDLGRQLRSAATTVRMRCVRHGPFCAEHALLHKHWTLAALCEEMTRTLPLMAEHMWTAEQPLLQPLRQEDENQLPGHSDLQHPDDDIYGAASEPDCEDDDAVDGWPVDCLDR